MGSIADQPSQTPAGTMDDCTQSMLEALLAFATFSPALADLNANIGCMSAALNALLVLLSVRMEGIDKVLPCLPARPEHRHKHTNETCNTIHHHNPGKQ